MRKAKKLSLSKQTFIDCGWKFPITNEHVGYSSVTQLLEQNAKTRAEAKDLEQKLVYTVLARATSMMLKPESLNEPFQPIFQDFQNGRRSAIPEDFTAEEVGFFEDILNETEEPWLKARLADLLWLLKQPKNVEHARIAINCYSSHKISDATWRIGVDDCWQRAFRLCRQISDFDRLNELKNIVYAAFQAEYPNTTLMPLWLATLMNEVKIDSDYLSEITLKLSDIGKSLSTKNEYYLARHFFDFAANKYRQNQDDQGQIDCLVLNAECYENEADCRKEESNMVANSLYEDAIQAYRRVPIKYRSEYNIEDRIKNIRSKMSEAGKASLDEMASFTSPGIDISDDVKLAVDHVSNKQNMVIALLSFTGLYGGFNYDSLKDIAAKALQENPLSAIIGGSHYGEDGRVVAKTPSANLNAGINAPENMEVLNHQIQQNLGFEIQLVVKGRILPALNQLLMEYRFALSFFQTLCRESKFVPANRERLMAYALWKGFEFDFGNAIHLLCPQLEHCIRTKLKDAGAHTSNIDPNGIENESGLSTLMELPEAIFEFGEDVVFEIKSIFTDSIGKNLRNETAHGLLDDESASSLGSVYAWWMVLRLIVRSIPFNQRENDTETENNDERD